MVYLLKQLWNKLPVIVRSVVMGLLVQIFGIMPIFWLLMTNVQIANQAPWAVVVGLIYLWVFWNYVKGKGWPRSTSNIRSQYLRANPIKPQLLTWVFISGSLFAFSLSGMILLGWMFVPWPTAQVELMQSFAACPPWTIIPLLIMGALATGVVEESAYRGYMQGPIENRHGAVIGIGIAAIVFSLSHSVPLPVLPVFIVGSIGWGVLAFLSNSILPGILFHTIIDAFFFVWGLYNIESLKNLLEYSVIESGITSMFSLFIAILFVFGSATIFSFRRLTKLRSNGQGLQNS